MIETTLKRGAIGTEGAYSPVNVRLRVPTEQTPCFLTLIQDDDCVMLTAEQAEDLMTAIDLWLSEHGR